VLKALCAEAGWIVDEDGSTYRKAWWRKPFLSPPASSSPSHIRSS
jgi:hypothetical protein